MSRLRVLMLAVAMLVLAIFVVGQTPAQPEGDLKKTVREIAELYRKAARDKSEPKAARALAAKVGKNITETTELMAMFRTRQNGGLGVGATPGPMPTRDGIEATIRALAQNVTFAALKDVAALEEMGYIIAAMGEIVHAKGWPKDEGKKTRKLWDEYAHDTHTTGLAFARVVSSKNPAQIKMAASKVNNACGGCHAFFKE